MTVADRHLDAPARYIHGVRPRSDIRSVLFHMAEGWDVAGYLSRDPARGVSVQYTIERDGEIVSMVPENRVAGSVNPGTIRTTTIGYYGADHARHVLGSLWRNPNRGIIAVEIAGVARDGPNDRQVEAAVRLFQDCRGRYPDIRPLGHRDLQNVKPCPGSTPAIKRMFQMMGGHGLEYRKELSIVSSVDYRPGTICDVAIGTDLLDSPNGQVIGNVDGTTSLTRDRIGPSPDGKWIQVAASINGVNRTAWVRKNAVSRVRAAPPPGPDPRAIEKAKAEGYRAGVQAAKAAIAALP